MSTFAIIAILIVLGGAIKYSMKSLTDSINETVSTQNHIELKSAGGFDKSIADGLRELRQR